MPYPRASSSGTRRENVAPRPLLVAHQGAPRHHYRLFTIEGVAGV